MCIRDSYVYTIEGSVYMKSLNIRTKFSLPQKKEGKEMCIRDSLQVMRAVNFDDYESLQYFERVLQSTGVIAALEQAGASEGDTVSIYGFDFDFVV